MRKKRLPLFLDEDRLPDDERDDIPLVFKDKDKRAKRRENAKRDRRRKQEDE